MAVTINGTTGIDKVQDGTIVTADIADSNITTAKIADNNITTAKIASSVNLGRRNMVINGDMRIDQRNNGSSVTVTSDGYGSRQFSADRWNIQKSGAAEYSLQQVSDAPLSEGFTKSLKATVTTADTSISATDYAFIIQRIEGHDTARLRYGWSTAKTSTVSFWVKSSLTGTFSIFLGNGSDNRFYVAEYTISSANTWEYKSITISGETTGTWDVAAGQGVNLGFSLSSGYTATAGSWVTSVALGSPNQVNVSGTLSATFQITGVQFELGDTATPFEHRSIGEERSLCQRYYEKSYYDGIQPGTATTAGVHWWCNVSNRYSDSLGEITFKTEKRATPSMTYYPHSGTITAGTCFMEKATAISYPSVNTWNNGLGGRLIYVGSGSTYTQTQVIVHWIASAEL